MEQQKKFFLLDETFRSDPYLTKKSQIKVRWANINPT